MEKIYVLIKVDAGSLETVYGDISAMKGIKVVDAVTGPYDLFVIIEGESVATMLGQVVRDIRAIEGIISTETLVTLKLD